MLRVNLCPARLLMRSITSHHITSHGITLICIASVSTRIEGIDRSQQRSEVIIIVGAVGVLAYRVHVSH
jgi:hypothetical protein